jgi:hypothetical protein
VWFLVFALMTLSLSASAGAVSTESLVYVNVYDENKEYLGYCYGIYLYSDSEHDLIITSDAVMGLSVTVETLSGEVVNGGIALNLTDQQTSVIVTESTLSGLSVPAFADTSTLSAGQQVYIPNTTSNGVTLEPAVIDEVGADYVSFSADIDIGIGGMLLTGDGALIGMTAYTNDDSTSGVAMYIADIINAFAGDDAPETPENPDIPVPELPDSYTDSESFYKDLVEKYGIPILLIVIGLLVYFVSKKWKVKTVVAQENIYAPIAQEPVGVTQPAFVNSSPSPSPPPPPTPVKLNGSRGTGGQYNTNSFPINDRIAIGRDSSRCSIVFEPNTNGVSGFHCEIVRVGNGLQLIDRGSTYGTFLNGTKLQVNVPADLRVGSSFYLGAERNSFAAY